MMKYPKTFIGHLWHAISSDVRRRKTNEMEKKNINNWPRESEALEIKFIKADKLSIPRLQDWQTGILIKAPRGVIRALGRWIFHSSDADQNSERCAYTVTATKEATVWELRLPWRENCGARVLHISTRMIYSLRCARGRKRGCDEGGCIYDGFRCISH